MPFVLVDDWPWPSKSNLTSKSKFTPFWACPVVTHHRFKLESPNWDQRCKIPWLRSISFWGLIEFDRSNLTQFKKKTLFALLFVSLKYLWDMQKQSLLNCSTFHMAPQMPIPLCTLKGSVHGPWTCLGYWDPRAVDSVICTGFYKLLSVFANVYTPHMPTFYMPTFGNCRNKSKTAFICLYFPQHPTEIAWLRLHWSVLFWAW